MPTVTLYPDTNPLIGADGDVSGTHTPSDVENTWAIIPHDCGLELYDNAVFINTRGT